MQKNNPHPSVNYTRTPKMSQGYYFRLIKCDKCGQAGGTMVKVEDKTKDTVAVYRHVDEASCRIWQLRKPLTRAGVV